MANSEQSSNSNQAFDIVGLYFPSFYLEAYEEAIAFYSEVFGLPDSVSPDKSIHGWHMGSTWLTLFPSKIGTHPDSNPRNGEFAIQVATAEEVDRLHAALIAAGAKNCWTPEDTEMYEPMRFSCVDDPFGIRIDVYCPTV